MTEGGRLSFDYLYQGDCVKGMKQLADGSIDLVFADPPFNIGYEYDLYEDRRESDAYLNWTRDWGNEVVRVLKPTGAFWLAIGDEYAAESKILFQREFGLSLRNWVIWYYTFGVHCTKKFSRSHAHLFYFVKDPKRFTFNDQAIRVPSARQLVYSDNRANPRGKLPDDTWILRPQDLADGFSPDCDTWYFARVCGTFKERAGWHGCQMPERLLARIIESCSNAGQVVLDPFAGSGTTLAVAKKLDRRYLGFELSPAYTSQVNQRLLSVDMGHPLEGTESPQTSGKPTPAPPVPFATTPESKCETTSDLRRGIIAAFLATRDGFSADRVIADPEINWRFVEMCRRLGLPGNASSWNHFLMNIRKSGSLREQLPSKRTTFSKEEMDKYSFACEIAVKNLCEERNTTLDRILCDPSMALEFDQAVRSIVPETVLNILTSIKMRWTALYFRKKMRRSFVNYARGLRNALPIHEQGATASFNKYANVPNMQGSTC